MNKTPVMYACVANIYHFLWICMKFHVFLYSGGLAVRTFFIIFYEFLLLLLAKIFQRQTFFTKRRVDLKTFRFII